MLGPRNINQETQNGDHMNPIHRLIAHGHPELAELQRLFSNNLYMIPVDKSNIVLLASNANIPVHGDIDFTSQEKKFGLPFRQYYNKLTAI